MKPCSCGSNVHRHQETHLKDGSLKVRFRCDQCRMWESWYIKNGFLLRVEKNPKNGRPLKIAA